MLFHLPIKNHRILPSGFLMCRPKRRRSDLYGSPDTSVTSSEAEPKTQHALEVAAKTPFSRAAFHSAGSAGCGGAELEGSSSNFCGPNGALLRSLDAFQRSSSGTKRSHPFQRSHPCNSSLMHFRMAKGFHPGFIRSVGLPASTPPEEFFGYGERRRFGGLLCEFCGFCESK